MAVCDTHAPGSAEDDLRAQLDASWPRKRVSAAVLLRDGAGRVLLVKPSYRSEWLLPGGVVEAGEAPAAAALREVGEETGLAVTLAGLLCVDRISPQQGLGESLHFLFDARVEAAGTAVIQLPPDDEIVASEYVEPAHALTRLPQSLARRLGAVLAGNTGYFDDGRPLLPFASPAAAAVAPTGSPRNPP